MPKTLLLADDSVTIQKVVGISFANEDVVLLTVDNGDDAVVRAQEARPDLVLADVAMPGKDGYEVCEAIKADPALRHVPVLLLSGTFETFDEERARQVGADGHITKPFEAQALVDRVNDLLARAESARPVAAADTTVLVSERPPAGEAFDFFDEEFAETSPAPAVASAATAAHDEDAALVIEPMSPEPLELEAAVESELDAPIERGTVVSFDDEPIATGDGHATMLFDVAPPPVPAPSRSDLDAEFGVTRSSSHPLVPPPPTEAGAATRLLDADADPLDFGLEPAGEPAAIAPVIEDPEPIARVLPVEPPADVADELYADDIDAQPAFAPTPVPVSVVEAPAPAAPQSHAPAASSAHLDALRGELREHLEKVAWEAFGDLSERIVKETVARVEAVAWEVIPQMAETLIREEIRKLKGDE
jgi:CheY-like chemotaxis protein